MHMDDKASMIRAGQRSNPTPAARAPAKLLQAAVKTLGRRIRRRKALFCMDSKKKGGPKPTMMIR